MEQSGKWPQQACSTMFFLMPKNFTSERPIALMPTLLRWWEALRAPEVAKWQQTHRIDWDVRDGRNGGTQQTMWEVLMEVERYKYRAGRDPGLGPLSSGRISLWCGPAHRTSAFQGRSCECCAGTSSTRDECSLTDLWRSRSRLSRPYCQGQSGFACSAHCVAGCTE